MTGYDPTNRRHIRIASKEAEAREQRLRGAIVEIMSTDFGREWVHSILSQACIFHTSFTGNPNTTAFNEGQRNIGLMILSQLMTHCQPDFILMMREANERDATSDARRERSDEDSRRNHRGRPVEPIIGDDAAGAEPRPISDDDNALGQVLSEYEPGQQE